MIPFAEFISGIDFTRHYDSKILPKKGGGRDHISPSKYRAKFQAESDWISERCKDGSYKFSPYAEKLILKGKGKLPRVLSVPNVRDRFVLSILNEYLNESLDIKRETPNRYIYRLTEYVSTAEESEIYFFKTDISSFYDNINHSILYRMLSEKIDPVALKLVVNAITTPTLPPGQKINGAVNTVGVPQGLAISNILAELYVSGFHKQMEASLEDGLFLRYVDDILIISKKESAFDQMVIQSLDSHNLGLKLTPAKTKMGKLGIDCFEFIGYSLSGRLVSVRESNKNRFADRIVRRCHQIRNQYEKEALRPRYVKGEEEFLDFARTDLNFLISGFKLNNHNYGWMAYFQQINDLKSLYQIDSLVRKSLGKDLADKLEVNSLVRTYHDLRENKGRSILVDFDKVTQRGEKIGYLKKFGRIRSEEADDYSDEDINERFNRLIESFKKSSQISIGMIS